MMADQYKFIPVDNDPWSGASGEGVAFDTTNYAMHLTEEDKERAAQQAAMQAAAESQANPVTPRQALLQGFDPDVSEDKWKKDLKDSLAKEGASPLTSALAKTLGVGERVVSEFLGLPKQAFELGQKQSDLSLISDPEERARAQSDVAGQSLGTALGVFGGGTPFPRPAGSLGIFGGRLAETADGRDLTAAQLKTSLGADPGAVWAKHGWYKDIDGHWKFEIPDAQAELHPGATPENLGVGKIYNLGDALHHPAFFDAYPEAKNWGLGFSDMDGLGRLANTSEGPVVQLSPSVPPDQRLAIVLHEMQHGVQDKEGFARGAAMSTLQPAEQAYVQGLVPEFEALRDKATLTPQEQQRYAALNSLFRQVNQFHDAAYSRYNAAAGEVEARNVEARMGMDRQDRRSLHPDQTTDVAPEDRHVAFQVEGGPQSAAPKAPQPLLPSGWHPDAAAALQQEHDFLAQHLTPDSELLGKLQDAIHRGPGELPDLSSLHRGAVSQAQQLHQDRLPVELSYTHKNMIDELQNNKREVTRDGETFWEAPEPQTSYTRDQAEQLRNHGYHMVESEGADGRTQRSWVWSKDLPEQPPLLPRVHLGQPQQQANIAAQQKDMTTTPDSRLASSLQAFPGNFDPEFHGHMTSLLAKGDMHAPEFLSSLYGGKGFNQLGMHLGQGQLDVSGNIGAKSNPGYMQRTFDVPGNSVEHEYFELPDNKQGGGFGKKVLSSQVGLYQKLGLDKITTYANIDVGSYAWAKYGFKPTKAAWQNLQGKIKSSDLYQQLPEDVAAEVDRHLASSDPASIWHLSDMKTPAETEEFGQQPLGKALLRGRAWRGELSLSDPASLERFNAYVGKKKAKSSE